MLLIFREMYGLGKVGAVTKVLLLLVGKDICWICVALRIQVIASAVKMGFYPPFYRFSTRIPHPIVFYHLFCVW